jgi:hypothetical protein
MTDAEGVSVLIAPEDVRYQAPLPEEFGRHDYLVRDDLDDGEPLRELAHEVIVERFEPRDDWVHRVIAGAWDADDITVLWKRRGGKAWGKCGKTPPLAQFLGAGTWTIWVAADHSRVHAAGREALSALLHHEFLHVGVDMESGAPFVRPHDNEVFVEEIAEHGIWREDLLPLVMTCRGLGD